MNFRLDCKNVKNQRSLGKTENVDSEDVFQATEEIRRVQLDE